MHLQKGICMHNVNNHNILDNNFKNRYIEKEENQKLVEYLLNILTNNTPVVSLGSADIDDAELTEYNLIPDTAQGAQKVRVCLQESDDFIMPGCANHLG
jgi:hypothetical protein